MGRLPTERREHLGGCEIHLVHGSPLGLNDFWWESLPEPEHRLRASASGADVICCTHSGLPWQRRVGSTLVVNVGVVGKPANDGRREVWYAIVDLAEGHVEAELVPLAYDWRAQARSMRKGGIPEAFVETIETGWWTTCLEVLPPAERSRGRYHLYRSALPRKFAPVGGTWGDHEQVGDDSDHLPVVPLFGTAYFPGVCGCTRTSTAIWRVTTAQSDRHRRLRPVPSLRRAFVISSTRQSPKTSPSCT